MATEQVSANLDYDKLEIMKNERKEMTSMVRENILDPLALFAGILSEKNPKVQYEPEVTDIAKVLKLMIQGAHVELGLHNSAAGTCAYPFFSIISYANLDYDTAPKNGE